MYGDSAIVNVPSLFITWAVPKSPMSKKKKN
jgi:hypothetical protein